MASTEPPASTPPPTGPPPTTGEAAPATPAPAEAAATTGARERGASFELRTVIVACVASAMVALLTSRLGVAGTVVGSAITPLLVALGSIAIAAPVAGLAGKSWWERFSIERLSNLSGRNVGIVLATAVLAFAATIGLLSVAEAAIGKPISSIGRSSSYGSGTTIGVMTGETKKESQAQPTPQPQPGEPPAGTPGQPAPQQTPTLPGGGQGEDQGGGGQPVPTQPVPGQSPAQPVPGEPSTQ